jgi:putative ABC transport system ATP-binding protein
MNNNQVALKSVTKYYDTKTCALNDVSLGISEGEWLSIIGPSGSGKTTLLNLICGLDRPTSGKINICGTDLTSLNQKLLTRFRRENIGLIFQQYHLVPYLTALENVMIAQYFNNAVDERAASKALERVGLVHRLEHRPSQLSGGEQQRVCIARALINEPNIVVADEPTGNLDAANGATVMNILSKLHSEGHTLILVTHNMAIANQGERIVKVVDGRIVADSHTEPEGRNFVEMKISATTQQGGQ